MRIDLHLTAPIARTFRVDQIAGMFDVPLAKKTSLRLSVEVPTAADDGFGDWKIGAIVGPSGSGKSAVARKAYGHAFLDTPHDWHDDASILDGFPEELSMKDITAALNAVGFSSPPSWVLPYRLLSNGQRFRADLAHALVTPRELVAVDEFTSVVDRQVGRFASAAVAKAVRSGRCAVKRFVAVTCHYDVLEWLEPEWVLDMASRSLARGSLRRPRLDIALHRCGPRQAHALWPVFAKHHYLSATLHRAARAYVAAWEGTPIALCATIPNAGHVGRRIVHRLVVLPDFQGLGVGVRLLDAVAQIERSEGHRISIRTSHPALIASLRSRAGWRVRHVSRGGSVQQGFLKSAGRRVGSVGRTTASFEHMDAAAPELQKTG